MAISKKKKQQLIDDLAAQFAQSQGVILTDYRGLTMGQLTKVRRQLHGMNAGYRVVKNTLTKLALKKVGLSVPEAFLEGPTAIGFCYDDVAGPAKALSDFAKESKVLIIKGGLLGVAVLDAQGVNVLGTLPSREILLAQTTGRLRALLIGLVSVLQGPIRGLAYVLQARARQPGGGAA